MTSRSFQLRHSHILSVKLTICLERCHYICILQYYTVSEYQVFFVTLITTLSVMSVLDSNLSTFVILISYSKVITAAIL